MRRLSRHDGGRRQVAEYAFEEALHKHRGKHMRSEHDGVSPARSVGRGFPSSSFPNAITQSACSNCCRVCPPALPQVVGGGPASWGVSPPAMMRHRSPRARRHRSRAPVRQVTRHGPNHVARRVLQISATASAGCGSLINSREPTRAEKRAVDSPLLQMREGAALRGCGAHPSNGGGGAPAVPRLLNARVVLCGDPLTSARWWWQGAPRPLLGGGRALAGGARAHATGCALESAPSPEAARSARIVAAPTEPTRSDLRLRVLPGTARNALETFVEFGDMWRSSGGDTSSLSVQAQSCTRHGCSARNFAAAIDDASSGATDSYGSGPSYSSRLYEPLYPSARAPSGSLCGARS